MKVDFILSVAKSELVEQRWSVLGRFVSRLLEQTGHQFDVTQSEDTNKIHFHVEGDEEAKPPALSPEPVDKVVALEQRLKETEERLARVESTMKEMIPFHIAEKILAQSSQPIASETLAQLPQSATRVFMDFEEMIKDIREYCRINPGHVILDDEPRALRVGFLHYETGLLWRIAMKNLKDISVSDKEFYRMNRNTLKAALSTDEGKWALCSAMCGQDSKAFYEELVKQGKLS